MAFDAASHPSPSGSAVSPGPTNHPSHKRSVPSDAASPTVSSPNNADSAANDTKKRRTGPGSRGVANLTPEQLAKKRANDREAQRAIRERTKNQIESLERRIEELTSQQPYQDLQCALRAREAVEAENADIKQRLSTVLSLISPLVTPNSGQGATSAQAPTSPKTAFTAINRTNTPLPVQNVLIPSTSTSPGSVELHQTSSGSSTASISINQSQEQSRLLLQQRHDLRHSLDLGQERLGLNFLLDSSSQIPYLQSNVHGAQDTPQFRHVPMKHDWAATFADGGQQAGGTPPTALPELPQKQLPSRQRSPLAQDDWSAVDSIGLDFVNCAPTCPLDGLLLGFLRERRERAAEGLPTQEVIGPRYPSVSSLLNPANSKYSHPLSKVFTDMISTFPDISGLPERVAVVYIMFLIMRYQISPTRENYERLPEWAAPLRSQLTVEHPAWIDHIPFPAMRERLAREFNPREYAFDIFFVPFTRTLSLNWPYEDTDALLVAPDTGEIMINPVFERHLRRLGNWTLGEAFRETFPSLGGSYNFRSDSRS